MHGVMNSGGTGVWFLAICVAQLLMTGTRVLYANRSGMGQGSAWSVGALALLNFLLLVYTPTVGHFIFYAAVSCIAYCWFCWTRWTPVQLRRFSEHRRTANWNPLPDDQVPVSLWARPWGVRQWWPTWL